MELLNNFDVVEEKFNEEEAYAEANRCLTCKKPKCVTGCPAQMRIPEFIKAIKDHDLQLAKSIIDSRSELSSICSRICPHEKQCVGSCCLNAKKMPIQIGKLERFVNDNVKVTINKDSAKDYKVAVIGTGPASVAAAKKLAKYGVYVEMFEALNHFGGVMTSGIPAFRLPYNVVSEYESELLALGVKINYNCNLSASDIIALKGKFNKVFIGTGLTNVRTLRIAGENLNGVYNALEFLRKANYYVKFNEGSLPQISGTVVVVGAGNVAMDASRMALRLGASNVIIAYRRSLEEAPACKAEINEAVSEGVTFKFLNNPVEIIGTDKVEACKIEVMKLGEPDESGRRSPVGTGQYETIKCDYVISAIGQVPDKLFNDSTITVDHGYIVTNDSLETSENNIYAGGDIVLGAQTVVKAMVCGRDVASKIIEEIEENM